MTIDSDIDALRESILKNKEETMRLQEEKADALRDVAQQSAGEGQRAKSARPDRECGLFAAGFRERSI
jgi:hypothetical protein